MKKMFVWMIFVLLGACNQEGTTESRKLENNPALNAVFRSEWKKIISEANPLGLQVDGWRQFYEKIDVPGADSTWRFIAFEEIHNKGMNLAIYQWIYFMDGTINTRERIQGYKKRRTDIGYTLEVESEDGLSRSFILKENTLIDEENGNVLHEITTKNEHIHFRKTVGEFFHQDAGIVFKRCSDGREFVLTENEHTARLTIFLKQLQTKQGGLVLQGLYNRATEEDQDYILPIEIKLMEPRFSCNQHTN